MLLSILIVLAVFSSRALAGVNADAALWAKLMVNAESHDRDASGYLKAMRVAEEFGRHDARLHVATFNAACALRLKDPSLAEKLFNQDIADLETIDPDFPEIPCDRFELAKLYLSQKRHLECEKQLLKAIDIREKWQEISSNNPFNAQLFALLYLNYYFQNNVELANRAHERMIKAVQQLRSVKARTDCQGSLRYEIRSYVQNQPSLFSEAQARHLNEMALAFAKEEIIGLTRLGRYRVLANQLYQTANIYMALGDTKSAEKMVKQSLDLIRNELDTEREVDNLRLDSALLSQIWCGQDRFKETKELQEQTLAIVARVYGHNSKVYARELNDLAAFWESSRHPELAKNWKQPYRHVSAGRQ